MMCNFNSRLIGFSTVLLCSVPIPAYAQSIVPNPAFDTGVYVGFEGGVSRLGQISPHGGDADSHSKYKSGFTGLGILGYGFGNGLRTELEGGYRRNDTLYVRNAPQGHSGALGLTTVMLNGLYDIDLGIPIVPHLGVGLGYANARFDHAGFYNGHLISGHDNLAAYQGITGVDYAITDDLKATLDYHYLGTTVGRFKTDVGAVTKTSFSDQTLLVGLRFTFNNPRRAQIVEAAMPVPTPPPPAPTPVPAAQVRAPEAQRAFQVFFNFDKSDITELAAQTIQKAAETVKQGHLAHISVTGHTDTVGSARYNQSLSERRADAVKAELIRDGVPNGEIGTRGVGKNDLLVQTKDGVRDPQNRRAEIILE